MALELAAPRTRGAIERIHPCTDGPRLTFSTGDAGAVVITSEDDDGLACWVTMSARVAESMTADTETPSSTTAEISKVAVGLASGAFAPRSNCDSVAVNTQPRQTASNATDPCTDRVCAPTGHP
eukprot:4482564-Pyramimonas_sp.AAC.1